MGTKTCPKCGGRIDLLEPHEDKVICPECLTVVGDGPASRGDVPKKTQPQSAGQLSVECPQCGVRLFAPDNPSQDRVRCGKCQASFSVRDMKESNGPEATPASADKYLILPPAVAVVIVTVILGLFNIPLPGDLMGCVGWVFESIGYFLGASVLALVVTGPYALGERRRGPNRRILGRHTLAFHLWVTMIVLVLALFGSFYNRNRLSAGSLRGRSAQARGGPASAGPSRGKSARESSTSDASGAPETPLLPEVRPSQHLYQGL